MRLKLRNQQSTNHSMITGCGPYRIELVMGFQELCGRKTAWNVSFYDWICASVYKTTEALCAPQCLTVCSESDISIDG